MWLPSRLTGILRKWTLAVGLKLGVGRALQEESSPQPSKQLTCIVCCFAVWATQPQTGCPLPWKKLQVCGLFRSLSLCFFVCLPLSEKVARVTRSLSDEPKKETCNSSSTFRASLALLDAGARLSELLPSGLGEPEGCGPPSSPLRVLTLQPVLGLLQHPPTCFRGTTAFVWFFTFVGHKGGRRNTLPYLSQEF